MPLVVLPRFLVRAPLLPLPPFGEAARRLLADPLGALALRLASPALAGGPDGAAAARARGRYGRRAAFRATPHGLLAGVTVGTLGRATGGATGRPRAVLDLAWWRVAALGRALLDDGGVRAQARVRRAPSLLRGQGRVRWLAFDDPFAAERQADLDASLGRILDACGGWTPWAAARAAAAGGPGGALEPGADGAPDDVDDLLLVLIDDGLLHHDLSPPLVGPPAASWMTERLHRLRPRPDAAAVLAEARAALRAEDLAAARVALRALPGQGADRAETDDEDQDGGMRARADDRVDTAIAAVLVHQPARPITLDRRAVERAAALAPLLFRLQQALVPPAAERMADRADRAAALAAGELFGEGALDLTALALGDYGVELGADGGDGDGDQGTDGDDGPGGAGDHRGPPAALLRLLVDEIAAARGAGRDSVALAGAALNAILADAETPPTFELFLTPAPPRARGRAGARARPGDGWLVGLHAPAGASWGRFAAALGAPLRRALEDLAAAEASARPDQPRLDVAFAPSPALADLCAHPRLRPGLLALSAWPAPEDREEDGDRDSGQTGGDVVTPGDLQLLPDPAGDAHALRSRVSGGPVVPSPLGRVRSRTAPPGAYRLLTGWSLYRQHAPWALALGPLADLAYVPRITVDGFVVSPASWRIPPDVAAGATGRAALRRWRRGAPGAATVPRFVQIGAEDALLPVDLDDPSAAADLAGQPRAWEIWPPVTAHRGRDRKRDRSIDDDGRRIEAVVAVVDVPDADQRARAGERARAIAAAGSVPPPRLQPPAAGWRTFKLFGAEDHQDDLLLDVVHPAVAAALEARARARGPEREPEREAEITGWFFQRYVDGPGRRPHLRLRVRAADDAGLDAFAARLRRGLGGARASGAAVTVEIAEYFPERARLGGDGATDAAHHLFQSSSLLACDLLDAARGAADPTEAPDRIDLLVMAFDALAEALGLPIDERRALARRRRDALAVTAAPPDDDHRGALDAEFRARARGLRAALGAPPPGQHSPGAVAAAIARHRRRAAGAAAPLDAAARARLAPLLLHLDAVRLAGPHRALEARAYTFWERTLEGLLASARSRTARRP